MALTYGFFNSVDGDRKYNAIQMSSIFDGVINDGVYGSIGEAFFVSAYSGMDIIVGTGRAWFDHTWTLNDADITLTVSPANPILARLDTIVLEVNEDTGTRANSIKLLTGTPASEPEYPELTNSDSVHQYPLAHILVNAGVTTITQSKITNMVGTESCPFVTGLLSVLSTNELVAQWESQFEEWFADLQNQLDENQASNLQNQIYNHDHSEELMTPVVGIADDAVTELTILAGAVTTGKIADDAVDDTKIGDRVPQFYRRKGSSETDWSEGGSTTQIPEKVRIQAGSMHWINGFGANSGSISISIPVAFAGYPLVFAQYRGAMTHPVVWTIQNLLTNSFTIDWKTIDLENITTLDFDWVAYGPE